MFKKILKWTGILLASLIILILLLSATVYFNTEHRANKLYKVNIQKLPIPADSATYALGAHVAGIRGCNDCHNKGGKVFFDAGNPIALLYTANLTTGKGGLHYTDEDWIRALRHGIGKNEKPLWFMPAQHTCANLSNQELAALIYYLKQLPPVDTDHPQKMMKPLGRVLTFFGIFPMFPAEFINHTATFPDVVKPEPTAAYGKYLVLVCEGCHGPAFKGGESKDPGSPPIPDISTSGRMGKWTSDQFVTTLHTGKTPDGRTLTEFMPWKTIGNELNENELKAIYLYLHQAK